MRKIILRAKESLTDRRLAARRPPWAARADPGGTPPAPPAAQTLPYSLRTPVQKVKEPYSY